MNGVDRLNNLLNNCGGEWKMVATNGGSDHSNVWLDTGEASLYPHPQILLIYDGNEKSWDEWEEIVIPEDIEFSEEDYENAMKNDKFELLGRQFYYVD